MSQNVQFGIPKFTRILTLALSYIVPLNVESLVTNTTYVLNWEVPHQLPYRLLSKNIFKFILTPLQLLF